MKGAKTKKVTKQYSLSDVNGSLRSSHPLSTGGFQEKTDGEVALRPTKLVVPKHRKHVFVVYSHSDESYLRRLMVHLHPLERLRKIDLWVDTCLTPGDRWRVEIAKALRRASVAILLVSADFLASQFIAEDELPPLLIKAETDGTRIVPVILKPCRFSREPSLNRFQAINSPTEPMMAMSETDQEATFDRVAEIVEQLAARGNVRSRVAMLG